MLGESRDILRARAFDMVLDHSWGGFCVCSRYVIVLMFLLLQGRGQIFFLGVLFYKKRRAKKEAANRNGPDNKGAIKI